MPLCVQCHLCGASIPIDLFTWHIAIHARALQTVRTLCTIATRSASSAAGTDRSSIDVGGARLPHGARDFPAGTNEEAQLQGTPPIPSTSDAEQHYRCNRDDNLACCPRTPLALGNEDDPNQARHICGVCKKVFTNVRFVFNLFCSVFYFALFS